MFGWFYAVVLIVLLFCVDSCFCFLILCLHSFAGFGFVWFVLFVCSVLFGFCACYDIHCVVWSLAFDCGLWLVCSCFVCDISGFCL